MYQSVLMNGQVLEEDLLWKNCPEDKRGDYEYLLDVIDWELNTDPEFHRHHFMKPFPVSSEEEMKRRGYRKSGFVINVKRSVLNGLQFFLGSL